MVDLSASYQEVSQFEQSAKQWWDSEGEFYVYEPPMATSDDADNGDNNTNNLLH